MLQDVSVIACCFSPAVYRHRPRIWRIARFHPSQEGQERGGVLRYPVVRPGRELELPHLSLLAGAVLNDGGGEKVCDQNIEDLKDVV